MRSEIVLRHWVENQPPTAKQAETHQTENPRTPETFKGIMGYPFEGSHSSYAFHSRIEFQ